MNRLDIHGIPIADHELQLLKTRSFVQKGGFIVSHFLPTTKEKALTVPELWERFGHLIAIFGERSNLSNVMREYWERKYHYMGRYREIRDAGTWGGPPSLWRYYKRINPLPEHMPPPAEELPKKWGRSKSKTAVKESRNKAANGSAESDFIGYLNDAKWSLELASEAINKAIEAIPNDEPVMASNALLIDLANKIAEIAKE